MRAFFRFRRESYGIFEILAWPAVVWSAVELTLRATAMGREGLGQPALILVSAVMTVGVCKHMKAAQSSSRGRPVSHGMGHREPDNL
jgi:hypothetical protein